MDKVKLIALTGIDGSGKTTQAKLLIESMEKNGIDVSYVWSRWKPFILRPVISRWKQNITKADANSGAENDFNRVKDGKRKLLNNPVIRGLWLTAFIVDYGIQIFFKIRIRLLIKTLIVSDRIFYDSIIDQAINLENNRKWLLDNLNSSLMRIFFPQPDFVMYIDCPEDIAFSRKDDAPNIEYLEERRKLYLELADKYGWTKLDGTRPVNELAVEIKGLVSKRLNM